MLNSDKYKEIILVERRNKLALNSGQEFNLILLFEGGIDLLETNELIDLIQKQLFLLFKAEVTFLPFFTDLLFCFDVNQILQLQLEQRTGFAELDRYWADSIAF